MIRVKRSLVVGLVVMLGCLSYASAGVYTVNTSLEGCTGEGASVGFYDGNQKVGTYYSPYVLTTWLKFTVPVYAGEAITGISFNLVPQASYQYVHPAVYGTYVSNDSWTDSTITSGFAAEESTKTLLRAAENGWGPVAGDNVIDITGLMAYGEGAGKTLSMRLSSDPGVTGGYLFSSYLTVTTEAIPEPATIGLLGIGAIAAIRRRMYSK